MVFVESAFVVGTLQVVIIPPLVAAELRSGSPDGRVVLWWWDHGCGRAHPSSRPRPQRISRVGGIVLPLNGREAVHAELAGVLVSVERV